MKERILQFLQDQQISSTQFADTIGVQRSSVSHILSGRNNPSFDFIRKILTNYPDIDAEWLLLGKGDMYKRRDRSGLFDRRPDDSGTDQEITATEITIKTPEDQTKADNQNIDSAGIERVLIFFRNNTFTEYYPAST